MGATHFYNVGPWYEVVRLGDKCLYPGSNLGRPEVLLYVIDKTFLLKSMDS